MLLQTTHLSFTGVLGALTELPAMLRTYRRAVRLVERASPDLAVLVDAEVAGCPFALSLRRRRIPTTFFFPPQVWFWGAWRAPLVRHLARRVVCAFRPETAIYERAGVDTHWVGHPLRDVVRRTGKRDSALRAIGLDPTRPLVLLMPGSRRSEIARLLEVFVSAARLLQERDASLQFALPIASESLRSEIESRLRHHGLQSLSLYVPSSYDVLGAADVVLQSSGTATLETALLGVPAVIAYRLIPVEYYVARLFMRVPFFGLPNILLDEMVQPELLQRECNATHLAVAAAAILGDEARRNAIRAKLARLPELLGPRGAVDRAAEAILALVPEAHALPTSKPAERLASVA